MKIYLSTYWRISNLLNLCMIIIIIIGTIIFCIWSNSSEDYIMVLCALIHILGFGGIIVCSRKFLTYILWEKPLFQSYSFFKTKLCEVDTSKPVYYKIFQTPQGQFENGQFIAISNEQFQYQEIYGIAKIRFIQYYDWKKQIVLPYNQKTILLLEIDNWNNIS